MMNTDNPSNAMPDDFDRLLGSLDGLPDVSNTKPSTIISVPTMGVGGSRTFIVQTFRQREIGDSIFLQCIGPNGSLRLVIPPNVSDAISRQRDALTTKVRSKIGKANAESRKERGLLPGFMRNPGKRGKRGRKSKGVK